MNSQLQTPVADETQHTEEMRITQPQQILLVHPDERNRYLIKRALAERGFTKIVESAGDHHCINLLNEYAFDVVVVNVDLGDLDAWRLTRLIRSGVVSTQMNTPVFIVSETFSEQIALATAKEFEVNAFIPLDQAHTVPRAIEKMFKEDRIEPPRSSILIVEDYADTAKLVERVLKNRFHIETATDGEAGLAAWMERRHEIVLLDLMLPKISGEEVLTEILKVKPSQSVVMMTAFGSAEKAGSLIAAGAVDFISKPFRAEQLRHVCNIAAHREDYITSNQQFEERQHELATEKERALVTLNSIGDGVITTDSSARVVYMNPVAEHLTGWLENEAQGRKISEVFKTYHEYSRVPAVSPLERCLEEQRPIHTKTNILMRSKQGLEMVIEVSAAPIKGSGNTINGAVTVFKDSTAARNLEKQLTYHASHDPLTGLKNRQVFDQEVKLALDDCISAQVEHALCNIDVNEFKMINESQGSEAGDKLLQEVAKVLIQKVRAPSDAIARISGHEFAVLLRYCPLDAASRISENIASAFDEYQFEWEKTKFPISVSIGLSQIDQDSTDLQDIFASARAACLNAQGGGGKRVHVYTSGDDEALRARSEVQLASEIVQAERENRFTLFCQPIKSLADPDEISYEILIRMHGENNEIVSPANFLPAAERYNLIPQIDRWVVHTAFEWLQSNRDKLDRISHCAVNLSGMSLSDEGFYAYIRNAFEEFDVPASKICFEITETAAVTNFAVAGSFIEAIRGLGCKFALDDFGTGMSSFAYLKKLPVDYLKIDGMFVKDILTDPIDLAMVRSINDIGHVSGLKTIAEFVENQEIEDKLREIGVDYVQGYGISKPMPIDDMKF
ncbi:MAG: EAL domain-containing protein [Pseudomonadota bacterium]